MCNIKGCDREVKVKSRGLCSRHYERFLKWGDPEATPPLSKFRPKELRFWDKVKKECKNGCWEWQGTIDSTGYGRFHWEKYSTVAAHRISYTLTKGAIPKGLIIDHLCSNRKCVNPDHLEAVTQWLNTWRGNLKFREQIATTHCPRGHEYNEKNTYRHRGHRYCRICNRESKMRNRKS